MTPANIAGMAAVAGLQIAALTDHNTTDNCPAFWQACKAQGIIPVPGVKNRPDIFGHQLVMDCTDQVLREEETLLLSATSLTLEEGTRMCRTLGGVCMPAHIDRESNGIISVLGTFPAEPGYTSSDAHYLWDISGAEHSMEIQDEPYSSALVRENLLAILENK